MNQHWIFSFSVLAWVLIASGGIAGWASVEALGSAADREHRSSFRNHKVGQALFLSVFVMGCLSLLLPHTPEDVIRSMTAALLGGSVLRLLGPPAAGLALAAVMLALLDMAQIEKLEVFPKANRIAVRIYRGNELYICCFCIFMAYGFAVRMLR